jgi:hypothetical protein
MDAGATHGAPQDCRFSREAALLTHVLESVALMGKEASAPQHKGRGSQSSFLRASGGRQPDARSSRAN